MKIAHKAALAAVIPLLAFLVASALELRRQMVSQSALRQLDERVRLLETTSAFMADMQKERGRTAVYLAQGCTLEDLRGFRQKTDPSAAAFVSLLQRQSLPESDKRDCLNIPDRLQELRRQYSVTNAALCEPAIENYTALIQRLLELERAVSEMPADGSLTRGLTSLLVLQNARDCAGRVRAYGSSYISADLPLKNEQFVTVLNTMAAMDAGLDSPALSSTMRSQIKAKADDAQWRESARMLQVLLAKASEGKYSLSGTSFFAAMSRKVDDLTQIAAEETRAMTQQVRADLRAAARAFWIQLGVLVGLAAGVILMVAKLSRDIIQRISHVVEMLKGIAEGEGDLTQRLAEGQKDELGQLAVYFNRFIQRMQKMTLDIRGNASELEAASGRLRGTASQMAGGVKETAARASQAAQSANESSASTQSVSNSIQEASSNLSAVAAATEEMSTTVSDIASNTEKARAISTQAMTQTQEVSAVIQTLGEAAKEIGKVTETITEISSQTNLLALNATIEAARAGAAGKGFAVVASEIKELARQTAAATEDIKAKIAGVQNSTGGAIEGISKISGVIQETSSLVANIAASIEEQAVVTKDVAGNISHATARVLDASQQVADMAASTKSIAQDASSVDAAAGEIREGSERVRTDAGQLAQLSGKLNSLVARFKV